MKKYRLRTAAIAIVVVFAFASCHKTMENSSTTNAYPDKVTKAMISENGANPDELSVTENMSNGTIALKKGSNSTSHYLYTESNAAAENQILAYEIMGDGSLMTKGATASGGMGTGAPLGSQGALAISADHNWLFAVNAGSNSVSSFKINPDGSLDLTSTVNSEGNVPVSLTIHDNMLYVLNRGSDNIHGFWVSKDGMLTQIAGSTRPLSGTGVDAPQISFSPKGDILLVTEKATNIIGSFKVMKNKPASWGQFHQSTGNTPFGFDFARDHYMIVSNAEMGGAYAGSATSYFVLPNQNLREINGAIANQESAPCWVATTKYGRFAYITNTATNNISSYYIAPWGGLYLVEGSAATTGAGPLDIVVASNNFYVYSLNAGAHNITGFYRELFGGLASNGSVENLPAGATGLATF